MIGLKKASGSGVISLSQYFSTMVGEIVVYGRHNDKGINFNWLISKIYLLGMGETLLSQHLYKGPRIEGEFDFKAWTCVSHEFDKGNKSHS